MSIFGAGHEVVTSSTKPASPSVGQMIYCTDTDEYLKYLSYGGSNRWMQAMPKPNRNIAINGDFSVAQRSTGSVALTTGSAYGSADRWLASQATSASGSVQQITTSLPTQATNGVTFRTGLRFGRTASATTTGSIQLSTAFETVNSIKLQSKPVTLSFWGKAGANYSSASSALTAQVWTGTGTDQAANNFGAWTSGAQPINSTATLTTSWAFYSYTGTLSATTTQVGINFAYTPVGTAGADDNVYITGVQLEIGSAPSEFEFREYSDELRRCQRYYYRIQATGNAQTGIFGVGAAATTSLATGVVYFPTVMRSTPTALDQSGVAGNYKVVTNNVFPVCTAVPVFTIASPYHAYSQFTTAAVMTVATPAWLSSADSSGANAYLGWSAEL